MGLVRPVTWKSEYVSSPDRLPDRLSQKMRFCGRLCVSDFPPYLYSTVNAQDMPSVKSERRAKRAR
eukprot:9469863-Pyramimonas_sp.AAC.1